MLVLAACGGTAGGPSAQGDGEDGRLLSCGQATWPEDGLDDLPPLDTLPEDVLAAVDDMGEPVVDRSLPWRVAVHDGPDAVLVRALEPDDPDASGGATHASLALFRVDRDPTIPPGTWHYASADVCTPWLAEGNQGGPRYVSPTLLLQVTRRCTCWSWSAPAPQVSRPRAGSWSTNWS